MRAHLQELVDIYGESSCVSLVNQKGHELPIKEAFEKYIRKAGHLDHIPSESYLTSLPFDS